MPLKPKPRSAIPTASDIARAKRNYEAALRRLSEIELLERKIRSRNWNDRSLERTAMEPTLSSIARQGIKPEPLTSQRAYSELCSLRHESERQVAQTLLAYTRLKLERAFPSYRSGVQAMVKWIESRTPGTLLQEFARILPHNNAQPMDALSWESGFHVGYLVGELKRKNSTPERDLSPLFSLAETAWRNWKARSGNKGHPTLDELIWELKPLGVKRVVKNDHDNLKWKDASGGSIRRSVGNLNNYYGKWKKQFTLRPNVNRIN